jgi:hypothetical protein
MPPSVYRRDAAGATAGIPSCVAKQVTRPVRNREAPVAGVVGPVRPEQDEPRP